jgi:MoaA/NifB/PqqE/SkfB family radical SAM enzyme
MRQPTLEWQTNGICNYDCSYCIQSKKYRQGHPSDQDIERFLAFFARLPGTWEIKMSGGEPFAFRGFLEKIIPGLAALPHKISVLTNLSAPLSALRKFVDLVGDKLGIISASLHLEFISAEEFIQKATTLRSWLPPSASMVVNNVLVPGTLSSLEEIKRTVESSGLRYFPQVMKTKHGVHQYETSEKKLLPIFLGENPTPKLANTAPSYLGRRCYAGVEYFVLDQTGDAWACRTAKRHREGFLGNVLREEVALWREATPCPYQICPCTVPANRGMIEGVSGLYEAHA